MVLIPQRFNSLIRLLSRVLSDTKTVQHSTRFKQNKQRVKSYAYKKKKQKVNLIPLFVTFVRNKYVQ